MSQTPAYLSEAWRKDFPDTDIALALRFMHETWNKLVTQFPEAVHPVKCREPAITQNFGDHLQVDGAASALSGIFDYEVPKAVIDPITGKRVRPVRTDILYQDSAVRFPPGKRLSLIFEFKKLRNTGDSRSTYVGKNGVQRFLSGYYQSHANHVAFMVGLIHLDVDKTIDGLETRLKQADTRTPLHIQPDGSGNYVRKPSEWFRDSVNFDTVHSRTFYGDISDVTICHFFLEH